MPGPKFMSQSGLVCVPLVHPSLLPHWRQCRCWLTRWSGSTPSCAAPGPWAAGGPWWSPSGPWCACDKGTDGSTSSEWWPSHCQTPRRASVLGDGGRSGVKCVWECLLWWPEWQSNENKKTLVTGRHEITHFITESRARSTTGCEGNSLLCHWLV